MAFTSFSKWCARIGEQIQVTKDTFSVGQAITKLYSTLTIQSMEKKRILKNYNSFSMISQINLH